MIQIAPFRALHYDPEAISFISRVIAPPYDVIDRLEARRLMQRDPHNVVRLILGKSPDDGRPDEDYAGAAESLAQWRAEGLLKLDDAPAIYVCEQEFTIDEARLVRRGLIGAMLLEEFSSGRVLPHERTMAGPKADRLRLMEACRTNLSQVFGVFSDQDGRVDGMMAGLAQGFPLFEFATDDDVVYKLWRVDDPEGIGQLAEHLREETLIIADGHHRYETALRYRADHRDPNLPPGGAPEDFLPVFAVSIKSEGLRILPTHRLVRAEGEFDADLVLARLGQRFEVNRVAVRSPEELPTIFRPFSESGNCIGFHPDPSVLYVLRPRDPDMLAAELPDRPEAWRRLPVTLLHYAILAPVFDITLDSPTAPGRLVYLHDIEKAYWRVASGSFHAAFLLPPTPSETVEKVARAGERMPPKSTFYYPKIATGLAFYPLEPDCLPKIPAG